MEQDPYILIFLEVTPSVITLEFRRSLTDINMQC